MNIFTVGKKSSKMSHFRTKNNMNNFGAKIQIKGVCFARNVVKWDFFSDFQPLWFLQGLEKSVFF